MSLPAAARRRWGLHNGGEVTYLDLGEAVVIVPAVIESLRRELMESVTEEDWQMARAGFGDPELTTE